MEYNLYLKYDVDLDLNINDESGTLCDDIFAYIMHETDESVENAIDDEPERTKIGFVSLLHYNQALAMTYGVNITQEPFLTMRCNRNALMELDYTLITPETIDEIGATTNPNIMMLNHFGISAAWRNKGLGELVLKGIIKQMKGKCGYIIILNSEPQQFSEYAGPESLYEIQGVELAGLEKDPEKAQWKLNAFFQRCGFRQFKNYDNVFVCNVEQAIPERIEAKHPVSKFSSYQEFISPYEIAQIFDCHIQTANEMLREVREKEGIPDSAYVSIEKFCKVHYADKDDFRRSLASIRG